VKVSTPGSRSQAARLRHGSPDRALNIGGLTGTEIARLKKAVGGLSADRLLTAFDGTTLHLVPDVPERGDRGV
jgi:hypothetical protein